MKKKYDLYQSQNLRYELPVFNKMEDQNDAKIYISGQTHRSQDNSRNPHPQNGHQPNS
jgi:hypothetical protein